MSDKETTELGCVVKCADAVADALDADVAIYNGEIERHCDRYIIDECIGRETRKNLLLILVTFGGDANAAYRIARCFQSKYDRLLVYVAGCCKSAGTLIAIGAHELIFSDHGELGPLDVQFSKEDDLWGDTQSGLAVMDALSALQLKAFDAFEKYFLDLQRRSGGTITLQTSAEIATELSTGIFSQIYQQIDPIHLGEAQRAMSIAGMYGRRLLRVSQNIEPDALDYIQSAYPDHGFVIDRQEAEKLFQNVREPTSHEAKLSASIGDSAKWPRRSDAEEDRFMFLSSEISDANENQSKKHKGKK